MTLAIGLLKTVESLKIVPRVFPSKNSNFRPFKKFIFRPFKNIQILSLSKMITFNFMLIKPPSNLKALLRISNPQMNK